MLVGALGCVVAGGRGKRRTSEEVEWSEAIEGRCENVEEVDRRCEYVDEVEGRWWNGKPDCGALFAVL